MMASDWATRGGISRPVNRRGMTPAPRGRRFAADAAWGHRARRASLQLLSAADLRYQFPHFRKDIRDNRVHSGGIGVEPIGLPQREIGSRSGQKERIEQ